MPLTMHFHPAGGLAGRLSSEHVIMDGGLAKARLYDCTEAEAEAVRAVLEGAQSAQRRKGEPLTRDNEESLMLAIAEFIASSAAPDDPRLDVAYAIARHLNLGWTAAEPAEASGSAPSISDDEIRALRRFAETTEDDQSYDVPKEMMKKLAMRGAVTRGGRPGWYFMTEYGEWLLDCATATPSASTPQPEPKLAAVEVTEEMVTRAMPHLIGVAGSEVRPVGQFYPGCTADESEFVNWKFLGRERVRRALTAALQGENHD